MKVHRSYIVNSSKLETTQMSTNTRMEKQSVVDPYLVIKKEWSIDTCNDMNESHRKYVKWKELAIKEYPLHDCTFMMF